MLDVKTLEEFVKEVGDVWGQFCVWKHTNNKLAVHPPQFEKDIDRSWSLTADDFIAKNRKFQNFWTVTLPSLQHGWMISVARLMDEAFFDPKKKTKPNLSLKYVVELLQDLVINEVVTQQEAQHQPFVTSILEWRHKYLAHNDLNFSADRISKGFEDYIEFLVTLVEKIKASHPELRSCSKLDLTHIDRVTEAGVNEIFDKILLPITKEF